MITRVHPPISVLSMSPNFVVRENTLVSKLDSSSFARWSMLSKLEHKQSTLYTDLFSCSRACVKQSWVDSEESEALALRIKFKKLLKKFSNEGKYLIKYLINKK